MTDFSKYKNITVDHDTYATITRLQTKITPDVKLSRSQVVKTLVNKNKLANITLGERILEWLKV